MTEASQMKVEFKSGLTWRVIFAMMVAALIFVPVSVFLYLSVLATIGAGAVYVIVILFNEILRMQGQRLSKQELFTMYTVLGAVASGGWFTIFYWLVFRGYFVNSEIALAFKIGNTPIRNLVPQWMAPPPDSEVYHLRTLVHIDWLLPIGLGISLAILTFIAELALTMIFSILFIEAEPLRFPFAEIDYSLVSTLTERRRENVLVFLASMFGGVMYGIFLYVVPLTSGIVVIPRPWIDLTKFTEKILPGAMIGLATDPTTFIYGFVLPIPVAACILVGSATTYILLNSLSITTFTDLFPQWRQEYYYGMNLGAILQRVSLRAWLSPFIGFMVGLALSLLIKHHKSVVNAFRTLARLRFSTTSEEAGYLPLRVLLLMFFGGVGISIILYYILIPEVPVWIPLLISLGMSFVMPLAATRVVGEIGVGISFNPWQIWQALLYFSGYTGYAGWVTYPVIAGTSTPWSVQTIKVAYMTETRPRDLFKAFAISLVLTIVFGFIFMDLYWRMAPIPSFVYPFTIVYFPTYAISDCLFATRQILIDANMIGFGALTSVLIFAIAEATGKAGIGFSAAALIGGFMNLPPYAIMVLISSIIGNLLISRLFGKEWWLRVRGIIVAAFAAGMGIATGLGVSLTFISRSSWIWPY